MWSRDIQQLLIVVSRVQSPAALSANRLHPHVVLPRLVSVPPTGVCRHLSCPLAPPPFIWLPLLSIGSSPFILAPPLFTDSSPCPLAPLPCPLTSPPIRWLLPFYLLAPPTVTWPHPLSTGSSPFYQLAPPLLFTGSSSCPLAPPTPSCPTLLLAD